jgi:hypothetical protein
MSSRAATRVIAFSVVFVVVTGCGGSDLTPVSGTVTVDGQPIQQGSIQFAPVDGKAPSEAAAIEGGKFSASLHRTKYRVQIYAPKVTKLAKTDEKGPSDATIVEELLPPRYNVRSELALDVAELTSDVRFDLKSK